MYTKQDIPREILYEEYIKKDKTIDEVVNSTGFSIYKVKIGIHKYNLYKSNPKKSALDVVDKEFLTNHWIIQNKTIKQISLEVGCSSSCISFKINKFKLSKDRKISNTHKLNKELLYKMYITENRSTTEIGKILEINPSSVCNYLYDYNIPIKKARYKDLSKKTFGKLFIKEQIPISKKNKNGKNIGKFWECKCECGNIIIVSQFNLSRRNKTSCGCDIDLSIKNATGFKDITNQYWKQTLKSARARKIQITITAKYAWKIWKKQFGKCAISGLAIKFEPVIKNKSNQTASIDRIDPLQGYTEGNIQWVHKDINKMKWNFEERYFIYLCNEVSKNKC